MYKLKNSKAKALLVLGISSVIGYTAAMGSSPHEALEKAPPTNSLMRLSTQIEAKDLRPFIRANPTYATANYICFSFQHAPGTEIGRISINSLVKKNRLEINDTLPLPTIDNFIITYNFRNTHDQSLGGSWVCSSITNPTGSLSRLNGSDVLTAIRLEAIAGSEESHGPIRFLLVGYPKYGDSTPSALATSTFGNLAPEGTLLNDAILMKQALSKYPKPISLSVAASAADEPHNPYASINPSEFKDSSLLIAGEYVKLAYTKYGKYPSPADADALLALMRAYGVVSTRTAGELAEQLGLK